MFAVANNNKPQTPSGWEENLDKILGFVKDSLEKGAEFAKEQAPIFIQELINYYTAYHLLFFVLSVVIFIISYRTIRKTIIKCAFSYEDYREKHNIKRKDIDDFPIPLNIGLSIIGIIVSLSVGIPNLISFFKVWLAPRLYLLEYASEIINGGGCGCG